MSIDLNRMIGGYMECASWADCGPDHETAGKDWSASLVTQMETDCAAFIAACGEPLLDALADLAPDYSDERFGHDFWLTRNGHGAGYWDRTELGIKIGLASGPLGDFASKAGESLDDLLTELAKKAGACELYVGDDNLVYAYGPVAGDGGDGTETQSAWLKAYAVR